MVDMHIVTAHKEHACDLCHKPIPTGTKYVTARLTPWNSNSDGFSTWRTHEECDAIYGEMYAEMHLEDELIDWQEVLEYWNDKHMREG